MLYTVMQFTIAHHPHFELGIGLQGHTTSIKDDVWRSCCWHWHCWLHLPM